MGGGRNLRGATSKPKMETDHQTGNSISKKGGVKMQNATITASVSKSGT